MTDPKIVDSLRHRVQQAIGLLEAWNQAVHDARAREAAAGQPGRFEYDLLTEPEHSEQRLRQYHGTAMLDLVEDVAQVCGVEPQSLYALLGVIRPVLEPEGPHVYKWHQAPEGLHEYERVATSVYTGEDLEFSYRSMNPPFWSEKDPAWRAQERARAAPLIDAAISGLAKLTPGKKGGTYYRGVRYLSDEQKAKLVEGNIVPLEGFASTSVSMQTALEFGHYQHLFVIKSAGGNYNVQPVSQFPREGEFLYPPGARFRVTQPPEEEPYRQTLIFHLEEIPAVEKRDAMDNAEEPDQYPAAEVWPEDWTLAQKTAHVHRLIDVMLAYRPTAEELAAAKRFGRKQDSAHIGPIETP